jgi:hypothetical protein
MHAPEPTSPDARRELVLVTTLLVALARLVAGPEAFVVAGLLPVAVLLAGSSVFGGNASPSRPYESLLIPAVMAGGAAAAIGLVPAGTWTLVGLLVLALVLDAVLGLEARLLVQPSSTTDGDRARLLLAAVLVAFVAFTGIAALVPGGLIEPAGASGPAATTTLTQGWLLFLVVDDAVIALLLGYRVASSRYGSVADAARSAITYAIIVGIGAGGIRAVGLPRLVGPAVLTLVFYLWDALHRTAPARRREPRFLWETVLLAVLAVVVVAWNLSLRG